MPKYSKLPDDYPKPLVNLLKFDDYTRGESEFSATDLIKPPQITQLTRRHASEMVADPRENIYRVLGTAVHNLLEQIGIDNPDDSQMIEKRLHATVCDTSISGQIDLHTTYEYGILTDWKHTKVSAIMYETKQEWIAQLNIYALLLKEYGYPVREARVCAIFRDWAMTGINGLWQASTEDGTKIVCKKRKNYPEWGCEIIPIPMWSEEETAEYLKNRVSLHKIARGLPDDKLPECTPEERWRRDTWRVRKIGALKAKGNKQFKTQTEALEYLETMGPEFDVSAKPGIPIRCIFYCDAGKAGVCHQLKREGLEVEWIEGDASEIEF